MTVVTVHEAKTNLSKLLKLVEAGEEVVIARGSVHVARIISTQPEKASPRKPGRWHGKFSVPQSAIDPLPEEELKFWEEAGEAAS